jgi:hypothetical protein
MRALRYVLFLFALGASLLWLYPGGGKVKYAEADPWFLDFLVANARTSLEANAGNASPDVVLVEFRESDGEEYSAWPPAPLDYIMLLKRLSAHEPEVLVFAETLRWEGENPEFLLPLRDALVGYPSVVFGFDVSQETDVDPEAEVLEFIASEMPSLVEGKDPGGAIPEFSSISSLPSRTLRLAGQMGITKVPKSSPTDLSPEDGPVALLGKMGDKIVPSVVAQAFTLRRRAPYSAMRLRLGPGARLSLGERYVIPLDSHAHLSLASALEVPTVNALELLTPEMGAASEAGTKAALGKGKIAVLSRTPEGHRQAKAIATALSMPALHQAPLSIEWALAAFTGFLGLWQMRQRSLGALLFGFGLVVAAMVISLLTFQSALAWVSPLPLLTVIATSTAFCVVWPGPKKSPSGAGPPPPAG